MPEDPSPDNEALGFAHGFLRTFAALDVGAGDPRQARVQTAWSALRRCHVPQPRFGRGVGGTIAVIGRAVPALGLGVESPSAD